MKRGGGLGGADWQGAGAKLPLTAWQAPWGHVPCNVNTTFQNDRIWRPYPFQSACLHPSHPSRPCHPCTPAGTFAFLLTSLDAGLKSLDVSVSSQCAAGLDNLAGYFFKHMPGSEAPTPAAAVSSAASFFSQPPGRSASALPHFPGARLPVWVTPPRALPRRLTYLLALPPALCPRLQAIAEHLRQRPDLFPQVLSTLFEIVLFEDCTNQWSLSRPMLRWEHGSLPEDRVLQCRTGCRPLLTF